MVQGQGLKKLLELKEFHIELLILEKKLVPAWASCFQ